MKTNEASRDAAQSLFSFNSFLIQEHLCRDERRDIFVRFQQEFDEKVSKLKAGVGRLTKEAFYHSLSLPIYCLVTDIYDVYMNKTTKKPKQKSIMKNRKLSRCGIYKSLLRHFKLPTRVWTLPFVCFSQLLWCWSFFQMMKTEPKWSW